MRFSTESSVSSHRNPRAEQVVTHQPAISFSNSIHFPFNRAGGRTSNVRHKTIYMLACKTKSIIKRIIIGCALCFVILIVAVLFLIIQWKFYPPNATAVIGPSGSTNRAFIENRSLGDLCFVLSASDWPHTFAGPASLGTVIGSEGSNSRVFWSVDGSVLVVKDDAKFESAYDYKLHQVIEYDSDKIRKLIASRGGLGAEQPSYPDGKGDY